MVEPVAGGAFAVTSPCNSRGCLVTPTSEARDELGAALGLAAGRRALGRLLLRYVTMFLRAKKVARSVALQQWALSSADSLEKKRPYLHEQPAGLCHPRLDLVGGSANFQRSS